MGQEREGTKIWRFTTRESREGGIGCPAAERTEGRRKVAAKGTHAEHHHRARTESSRAKQDALRTLPLLPRFKRRRGGLKSSVRPTCTDVVTSLPDEMDMRPSMCLICMRWQTLMHVYPMISDLLIRRSRCLDAFYMYTPLNAELTQFGLL